MSPLIGLVGIAAVVSVKTAHRLLEEFRPDPPHWHTDVSHIKFHRPAPSRRGRPA
jgi:hypothetical protein